MDMKKTGEFIAALRKEHAYTQEQLGEILGVSNKTVSRWETGVYFPPADVLLQMSEVFGVSINEILAGRRLADAEYKGIAEENLVRAMSNSSFPWKTESSTTRRSGSKSIAWQWLPWGFASWACLLLVSS